MRFGAFELDANKSELRRDGIPVKLPPQPLKILVSLATHPGQLLTREEIRQVVWGGDTFVDFELGLNGCLNQIRRALEDDARVPHYIETVARRGYRFIAPIATIQPPARSTACGQPSIAVLPFSNLSADKRNAYFSDGLADEIITALTRIKGLRVTARTSSFAFRGQEQDVREIGAKLGVVTVLEGSVQRSGGRIRVSAQLVSVSNGFHLWSDHYDRKLADVFAIQDEISQAIAQALELRLAPLRVTPQATDLDAYNCWLKARHYQHYENLASLTKCRTCLDQAIALDPQFPQPYLGLAGLFLAAANFCTMDPQEMLALGWPAIEKALTLDDSLGEGFAFQGAYRALKDFEWQGTAEDFERALALSPASEQVHRLRASHYLVPTSQLGEAEREMELAVESDPLSPLAYIELVKVLLWSRQFDKAQAKMQAVFDLWPDYALAQWYLGVTKFFQGQLKDALGLMVPSMQKIGPNPAMLGAIGMARGQLGQHAEARRMLREMEAVQRSQYVPAWSLAQMYLGLGDRRRALQLLDRAVDERSPHILDIPNKPIWDSLHDDPRFGALLSKMRLTKNH